MLFLDCFWCICLALKQGTVLHNLWLLWHSFGCFIVLYNCWKYFFFGWIKFGANCNCFRCTSYLLLQIGYHCVCWNFWADFSPGCWAVIHVSLPLNTGQFENLSGAFYSGHLAQVWTYFGAFCELNLGTFASGSFCIVWVFWWTWFWIVLQIVCNLILLDILWCILCGHCVLFFRPKLHTSA